MTFGKHVRLAGAVISIVGYFLSNIPLSIIGLMGIALGVFLQVDNLENRVAALEPKEGTDDETHA